MQPGAGRAPGIRRMLLPLVLASLIPLLAYGGLHWIDWTGSHSAGWSGSFGHVAVLLGATVVSAALVLGAVWRLERPIRDLERAEARFRALTELSSDWYWEQDENQRFTFLSSGHERVTGDPAEHFIGRTVEEVRGAVLSDTIQHKRLELRRVRASFRELEIERAGRDGRPKWLSVSGEPFFDENGRFLGYRGIGRDITAGKRAQLALRDSEERNRSLLEMLPEGVVVLRSRRIEYANPAFLRIVGASSAEAVLGRHLEEFFTPEHRDSMRERNAALAAGRSQTLELMERRVQRLDGTTLEVETAAVAFELNGERLTQGIVRDISERKYTEEQILRVNSELETRVTERTAALQAAVEELKSLTYTIAHDLRAPLRAIDGFSRMLVDDLGERLDQESQKLFDRIRRNARTMGELIDDLLGFAELGRQELAPQRIDLGALLREIAGDLSGSHPATKVEIDVLPIVVGDRSMLRRAFANLVGNAFKFSGRVAEPRVTVSAEWTDRDVVICIGDNGVGFDMRYAKKLFGVFQRLHAPNEFEGTGIGLAIVQRVAERHGGRVWAEARPGSGARFYFALPAQPASGAGTPA